MTEAEMVAPGSGQVLTVEVDVPGAGQLGNAPASSPVTRPVNTIAAGSRITQLSAGWGHMLALRSDGTVLAGGSNTGGQLGIGSTVPVVGPVQVTGLTAVSQVSAGGYWYLSASHSVWCCLRSLSLGLSLAFPDPRKVGGSHPVLLEPAISDKTSLRWRGESAKAGNMAARFHAAVSCGGSVTPGLG